MMASCNLDMLKRTNSDERGDECYTPEHALLPLLPFLDKSKVWYEATSGHSKSIVDCMRGNGFTCMESEGNFFDQDNVYDGIVTNPPFSVKDAFIERCYAHNVPFALLLPVSSIQGIKRGSLFEKFGIQLLVLNKRIDFTGKGSPHFGVAWFCYKVLPKSMMFVSTDKEY